MFEPISGLPADTVGLSASGTITGEDYERTLIPLVKEKMAAHRKVRMLLFFGPAFDGYSPNALWQDARFGVAHLGDFTRIAVVSDTPWLVHAVGFFAPFMRFPVRVFPTGETEAAKVWIGE